VAEIGFCTGSKAQQLVSEGAWYGGIGKERAEEVYANMVFSVLLVGGGSRALLNGPGLGFEQHVNILAVPERTHENIGKGEYARVPGARQPYQSSWIRVESANQEAGKLLWT
jgi:hypothetical protein